MPDGAMVVVVVRHILFGNNFHRVGRYGNGIEVVGWSVISMMIWWCYYDAGGSVDAVDADARCVEGNGWDGSLFNHMQMVLVVAALVIISTITNDDFELEDLDHCEETIDM